MHASELFIAVLSKVEGKQFKKRSTQMHKRAPVYFYGVAFPSFILLSYCHWQFKAVMCFCKTG